MNFDKNWGLGSSSTLINNISSWAKINPYDLLWSIGKGSGYDIASGQSLSALIIQPTYPPSVGSEFQTISPGLPDNVGDVFDKVCFLETI